MRKSGFKPIGIAAVALLDEKMTSAQESVTLVDDNFAAAMRTSVSAPSGSIKA